MHGNRERKRGRTSVWVQTGRGCTVRVPIGSPFVDTVRRIARNHSYGGVYRVFLNGAEILYHEDAPATIQLGMRIGLSQYDSGA